MQDSPAFELHREIWLRRPLQEIFAFFSEAANLEVLTPPWLSFRILTPPPIEMQEGAVLDYQLRIHGFPLKWKSEISIWQPPSCFVDRQLRGPYRCWVHEHRFEASDGGTWVRDRVQYRIWGGRLLHRWVRRDLNRIFDFREEQMRSLFG